MTSVALSAAELAVPRRKLAYPSPVLAAFGRSVIRRLNTKLPDDERSFDSLLNPKRYSRPALKLCWPAVFDTESRICVSRIGDWILAIELLAVPWLPSSA